MHSPNCRAEGSLPDLGSFASSYFAMNGTWALRQANQIISAGKCT